MNHWPASKILVADSKEQVFALIQEGYRLCMESDDEILDGGISFMCEGYAKYGQDRPRIPVTREAAESALEDKRNGGLRQMTDEEVRDCLELDPRNRKFYLAVM